MDKKLINLFYGMLVAILFFGGCSSKSALSVFGSDTVYEKGLEHTRVDDIVNSFETKAIINATYLNVVDPKKWDDQYRNFLVGIYIVDDNEDEKQQYINNKKYTLTLNGEQIAKIKELKSEDMLWEHIPLKNPQAKYYIISFKKDLNDTLNLVYSHTSYGKVTLTFPTD